MSILGQLPATPQVLPIGSDCPSSDDIAEAYPKLLTDINLTQTAEDVADPSKSHLCT